MYGNNSSRNRFNANQQSYWPRGTFEQSAVNRRDCDGQNVFPNQKSHFNPMDPNFNSQSTYTQRDLQQYGGDYNSHQAAMKVGHPHERSKNATMVPTHNIDWVNNSSTRFPSEHHNSFYHMGNNSVYNTQTGSYEGNTLLPAINQGNNSIYGHTGYEVNTIPQAINQSHAHSGHYGQPFQQNNIPCSTVETIEGHGHRNFQGNNVSIYSNQVPSQTPVSQEDVDKMWLKQWLEQRHVQTAHDSKSRKTLKISEAQSLFQSYLNLNNQLKEHFDELQKNVESESEKWNNVLAKAEKTKKEVMSVQTVLNDPHIIQDVQQKIHKRKQKRLWLKNRRRRRYLEQQEDEERKKVLHEKIDLWQKEIREKDLAASKAASLKHEAGGVLGEVIRKLQDCYKLQELTKSLVKLRELRKSEGEKKGVYPKTSSSEDDTFTTRCEYVEQMVEGRIKTYEEEEKALRVIIMEEEGEREKQEKQQRLEQKALLNLSKEADPLAEFRRYYNQADESIQYLIQIRREWDIYLTPDVTLGSRVPDDEDITAGPPTSSLWASVVEAEQSKNLK